MEVLTALLVAGAIMGLLDFLWLGFVAKKLYYGEIGNLLLDKPNMPAALLFYVIYVVGTVVFVINPALEQASFMYTFGFGALFGFVAYAAYDLTNLATMKGFSPKIVVIDMAWGVVMTATVAVGTYLITQALFS